VKQLYKKYVLYFKDVVLNGRYMFCTGAYFHYCYGAVHQAGKNLISHIIINPKGPSETNKGAVVGL